MVSREFQQKSNTKKEHNDATAHQPVTGSKKTFEQSGLLFVEVRRSSKRGIVEHCSVQALVVLGADRRCSRIAERLAQRGDGGGSIGAADCAAP
jgi:hypothetical protein